MRTLQQQLSRHLDHRVALAETRIAFVLAAMGGLFLVWISLGGALAPDATGLKVVPPHVRAGLGALLLSSILWNLYLGLRTRSASARGEVAPGWLRWVALTSETVLPSAGLVVAAGFLPPEQLLTAPFLPIYAVPIVLGALRLRPVMCLYGGVVAAVGCTAVAVWATAGVEGLQSAPGPHVLRGASLLFVGMACSVVAHVLREGFVGAAQALEDRNRVVGVFGRYLSDEVVDTLLHQPGGLELGGRKQPLTVLMTDLRGFSTLAAELPAEDVVRLLNRYLGEMTDVILAHGGTIDEFIGDAILVIFNAPLPQDDHARRALRCALAMQQAMGPVNAWTRAEGLPELEMGIGVHTGEAVVGNIGSAKRQKYGVVGTTVNLAARVEALTVGGQVLTTQAVVDTVGPGLVAQLLRKIHPKGAPAPLSVHTVRGLDGTVLEDSVPELVPIMPQRVAVARVEGKERLPGELPAELDALSSHQARVRLLAPESGSEQGLPVGTDLVLQLADGHAYARVVELEGSALVLRFTARDRAASASLGGWLAAGQQGEAATPSGGVSVQGRPH